jgi:hypothetical protein
MQEMEFFIEMERQFYCSLINRRREYITWNPSKPITGLDLLAKQTKMLTSAAKKL